MKAQQIHKLSVGVVCLVLAFLSVTAIASTSLVVGGEESWVLVFGVFCAGCAGAWFFLAIASIRVALWETAKTFLLVVLGIELLATSVVSLQVASSTDDLTVLLPLLYGVNIALSATVITASVNRSTPRSDGLSVAAFRFLHLAVAAHAILVTLSLEAVARQAWISTAGVVSLAWTELAATLLVIVFLNRRTLDAPFALIGAISATVVFASALAYAPSFYGWDLRPLGWYALLTTSVPFLLFLSMFLRYVPVFSTGRYLRPILAVGLFLILAFGTALQITTGSPGEFGRKLGATLDGGASTFHLSEITDFEWDSVEIYGPYTTPDRLSQPARDSIDIMTLSLFGVNDTFNLVLFISNGKAAYYEVVPSGAARFPYSPSVNPTIWKYEEANLTVDYFAESGAVPSLSLKDGA